MRSTQYPAQPPLLSLETKRLPTSPSSRGWCPPSPRHCCPDHLSLCHWPLLTHLRPQGGHTCRSRLVTFTPQQPLQEVAHSLSSKATNSPQILEGYLDPPRLVPHFQVALCQGAPRLQLQAGSWPARGLTQIQPRVPLPALMARSQPLQPAPWGEDTTSRDRGAWVTIGAVTAEANDEENFHGSLRPRGRSVRPSLPAPQIPSAARPPSHLPGCLPLHSLQNPAAASECSSSKGAGGGEGGAWRGRRRRRRERAACWHPEEEHVCSWPAAWGQRLASSHARAHTLARARAHTQAGPRSPQSQTKEGDCNPTRSPKYLPL